MLQEWINPLRNYKLHLLIYRIYKFPPGRNNDNDNNDDNNNDNNHNINDGNNSNN